MRRMSPRQPGQAGSFQSAAWPAAPVSPPSCTSTTRAFTPWASSAAAARLMASASSVKRSPATPEGTTMDGVLRVTAPMKPTRTPPTATTQVGGSSGWPPASTLAASTGKRAPG